jgi:hypothetical protein
LSRKKTFDPDKVIEDVERTSPLAKRMALVKEVHPERSPVSGTLFGISAEQRVLLCDALRAGNFRKTACNLAGVSYTTFNSWMKRGGDGDDGELEEYDEPYKSFVLDVRVAEAEGESHLLSIISGAALTDWKAASWILNKRNKEHWSDTDKTSIQVGTTGGVSIILPSNGRELEKGK